MSDLKRLKTYQMTVYMCGVVCVLCVRVCVCEFCVWVCVCVYRRHRRTACMMYCLQLHLSFEKGLNGFAILWSSLQLQLPQHRMSLSAAGLAFHQRFFFIRISLSIYIYACKNLRSYVLIIIVSQCDARNTEVAVCIGNIRRGR